MKKKNNTCQILLLVLAVLVMSCDKIEPPYQEAHSGATTGDTLRTVLLEDFTGHTCVNCPQAHKIAADLQSYYGEQLVVVAIHAGFFAKPKAAPYDYDFRTPEGDAIAARFGLSATPIGMVNRVKQSDGGYLVDKGAFSSEVSKQLDSLPKRPDVYIELEPAFHGADSTVDVACKVSFLKAMPQASYRLCLMVTEDDIVAAQKNNDPSLGLTPEILDYHHKHVLRGMISPTWGDEIMNGAPAAGQQVQKSYMAYHLGSDRVPEHCKVVAFVYYDDGPMQYQVIQAAEVDLK